MIDRMILALRISSELLTVLENSPDQSLSIDAACDIFRDTAAHNLTDDQIVIMALTQQPLDQMECPDGCVFYLAHVVYHIIQGEIGEAYH